MDDWRKYFESANGDIFEVIQQAIMVAVTDCPDEFRIKRDEIAEKLFTCRLPRCIGCDGVELITTAPKEAGKGVVKDNLDGCSEDVGGKDSKGACSTNVLPSDLNGGNPTPSSISYNEAEALTDIIEEESQTIEEVLRIKEILVNWEDESTSSLLESLRRLELMDITMPILMSTEIAKAVTALRKDQRKEIAKLSRSLVKSWKLFINEWIATSEAAKGARDNDSPDSVNPSSVIDEEEFALPSPPLDNGIFFAPEANSMELSKFFDGMDDDLNIDSGRHDDGRYGPRGRNNSVQNRKPQCPREQEHAVIPKDNKNQSMMKENTLIVKQNKLPVDTDSGFRKPSSKMESQQKANNEMKLQQRLDANRTTQRKPVSAQLDKPKPSENLLDQKLENAKRKLHQGYQQAENAKKQRTIQVMDLQDLPKQSFGSNSKSSQTRPGNHNNRNWSNGRR
ncbi:hypothetical protein ACHQM5_013145 [Ranunculus cassubicifolius]